MGYPPKCSAAMPTTRRTTLRGDTGRCRILLMTKPFCPCTTLVKQLIGKDEELNKELTNKIEE